jgi:23S rRNA pseudouridine2604 synthase
MAIMRVYAGDAPIRVNKWLAQTGICSRREAEGLIARGGVIIDGERVDDPGRKINPGQTLVLSDRAETNLSEKITVVINKPEGYVSSQPEHGQLPAVVLVDRARFSGAGAAPRVQRKGLAPLGRLDMDSHGLLLLSEDGVLAKAIIGPTSPIDKEYLVRVTGMITADRLALLRHGLQLDGRPLKPALVERLDGPMLRFVLTEGRNRQIRRMCENVYLEVVDLQRVRIGPIRLGDLAPGRWRLLSPAERVALLAATENAAPE